MFQENRELQILVEKTRKVIHNLDCEKLEKWSYTRSYSLYPQKSAKKTKRSFCEQIINLECFGKKPEKILTKSKFKNNVKLPKLSHKSDKKTNILQRMAVSAILNEFLLDKILI